MKRLPLPPFASALVLSLVLTGSASAQNGANKVHVSGSTVDVIPAVTPVTVLSGQVKTSTNSDLLLSVTAECAIHVDDVDQLTGLRTSRYGGQADDFAQVVLKMWVEVDGVAVPVDAGDDGRVNFCRRDSLESSFNQQQVAHTFENTRNANGFNWKAVNVGNGTHTVEVKAEVTGGSSGSPAPFTDLFNLTLGNPAPTVQGVVGRRSLVVEPVAPAK